MPGPLAIAITAAVLSEVNKMIPGPFKVEVTSAIGTKLADKVQDVLNGMKANIKTMASAAIEHAIDTAVDGQPRQS